MRPILIALKLRYHKQFMLIELIVGLYLPTMTKGPLVYASVAVITHPLKNGYQTSENHLESWS